MKNDAHIRYERHDGIGFVVLNRPDKLNAISEPMKAQIVEAFAEADRDKQTAPATIFPATTTMAR